MQSFASILAGAGIFMEEGKENKNCKDSHHNAVGDLRASVFKIIESMRSQLMDIDTLQSQNIQQALLEHRQLVQEKINKSQDAILQIHQEDKKQLQKEVVQLQQESKMLNILNSGFACAFAFIGIALYFESTHQNQKTAGLLMALCSICFLIYKANHNIVSMFNNFGLFLNIKIGVAFDGTQHSANNQHTNKELTHERKRNQ